jgi:hypothetical protein
VEIPDCRVVDLPFVSDSPVMDEKVEIWRLDFETWLFCIVSMAKGQLEKEGKRTRCGAGYSSLVLVG